jgi:hypothetical protein
MPEKVKPTKEQRIARQISALGDSVTVINRAIESGDHEERTHDAIDRNVRHLELTIAKDEIKSSGTDLAPFEQAIAAGKAYIAE